MLHNMRYAHNLMDNDEEEEIIEQEQPDQQQQQVEVTRDRPLAVAVRIQNRLIAERLDR